MEVGVETNLYYTMIYVTFRVKMAVQTKNSLVLLDVYYNKKRWLKT